MLVSWLEECQKDASEIFLMGDVFDFWFEYNSVVPKGFVRLLGKLAEITDAGTPVHLFIGNHDIWAFEYLNKEVGLILHRSPEIMEFSGRKFYLAHGDGLGPGDNGYKFLKKVFGNKINQWLFKWLHPDLGSGLGLYFSRKSRLANLAREGKGEMTNPIEDEMLYDYSRKFLAERPDIDYFIFGHRHLPTDISLNDRSRLIILGDWLVNYTYAVFDGERLDLKKYD